MEVVDKKNKCNDIKCTIEKSVNNKPCCEFSHPLEFFLLFLHPELLKIIVDSTNRYAEEAVVKAASLKDTLTVKSKRKQRIEDWRMTTYEEVLKNFILILYMGLVHLLSISDYWCRDIFYNNVVASSTMSRNRFEILLKMVHFGNSGTISDNKLWKIQLSIDNIKESCKTYRTPGKTLAIDESIVPFQGRLNLKQYLLAKRHRYGVKLFKACDEKKYTYNFKVYQGKEVNKKEKSQLSFKVVEELTLNYLG